VTTQSTPYVVERLETAPQTTRVEMYQATATSTNELAVDRGGRLLRTRRESFG
jgi:hypothetical protein